MDSLPPVLRRYVHEDNRWFQQELSEWEEQFCQTAAPQGECTTAREAPNSDPDDTQQTPVEPAPQSGPSPDQLEQARASPEAEPGAEKESREGPTEEHQGGCRRQRTESHTHRCLSLLLLSTQGTLVLNVPPVLFLIRY